MPTKLQAEARVSFASTTGDSPPLLIERDANAYADLDAHLLLYPAVDAFLATSAGTVRKGSVRNVEVGAGIVVFSGSATAQLPKPPTAENPTFQVLYSFDRKGQSRPTSIALDAVTGELKADAEVYAAVAHSPYKSRALELIYTPLTERLGTGVRTTYGVIAAYYPPTSQAIYQVEPFDVDQGNVEVELYRIVSYSVTNNDGEFELPPNYPADGAYPDRSLVLDTSNTLQTERAHEIGYMDQRGRAWVRSLNVPTLEPYVGSVDYKATRHCKVSSIPEGLFDKELIARASNFVKSRGYGCKGSSGA